MSSATQLLLANTEVSDRSKSVFEGDLCISDVVVVCSIIVNARLRAPLAAQLLSPEGICCFMCSLRQLEIYALCIV